LVELPAPVAWMLRRLGLLSPGSWSYIELHTPARFTNLVAGTALRGRAVITSPGRLVHLLAELTTAEVLIRVRKWNRRVRVNDQAQ